MQFSIYQESRRGARKSNQDRIAYTYTRDALLMLVADGMGGHLRGEYAAQIAMQYIAAAFRREARPRLADPGAFLRRALIEAHHAIVERANTEQMPETPRTTCVACVVQNASAYWAHAGDSRLYHIRAGRILAQTRDHSLVQQLIDSGRMREEAVSAHPERNRIFSCLGSQRLPRVDVSGPAPLESGDSLILCSDGLWSPLSNKIIGGALQAQGIMQAVPQLLQEAERRAGRECDNVSAVAMSWEGAAPSARPDRDSALHAATHPPGLPPQHAGPAGQAQPEYLSDDEIERAIDRIRSSIKGQSGDPT